MTPDSYPFSEREPPSMRGTKYVDAQGIAIIMSAEQRQRSCLPFVSWEQYLRSDEELLALGITYPRKPSLDRPNLLDDRQALRSAVKDVMQRFKNSGLSQELGIKRSDLHKYFPVPKSIGKLNPACTTVFYGWNVDEQKLFRAAGIHVRHAIHELFVHLIRPRKPRARFTQGGEGLVGVNPRLAAWRSWLDFQRGVASRHDYFMDLRNFAWLTLQHDLPYDHYLIGGTIVQEGDERRVLCATRTHEGWFVDEYRDSSDRAPAIPLMA